MARETKDHFSTGDINPCVALLIVLAYVVGFTLLAVGGWLLLSALVWITLYERDWFTALLGGAGLVGGVMATYFAVSFWRGESDPRDAMTARDTLSGALLLGEDKNPDATPELAVVGAVVVDAVVLAAWAVFAVGGSPAEVYTPWILVAFIGPALLLALSVMFFGRPRWLLPYRLRVADAAQDPKETVDE